MSNDTDHEESRELVIQKETSQETPQANYAKVGSVQFRENLEKYLRASCSGLYVDSYETHAVISDIGRTSCSSRYLGVTWHWNISKGLVPVGNAVRPEILQAKELQVVESLQQEATGPADVLKIIPDLQNVYAIPYQANMRLREPNRQINPNEACPLILVLENFDLFYDNPLVLQRLLDAIVEGRNTYRTYILVGNDFSKIPKQLSHVLHRVERPLPDKNMIRSIARELAITYTDDLGASATDEERFDAVFPEETQNETLHAVTGLSDSEIEDAFALTLVKHGRIFPKPVFDIKSKMVHKTAALKITEPKVGFSAIGGLESLKEFTLASLKNRADKSLFPKGVLLTGVSGTGKSQYTRCLGYEADLPVVEFRLGALLGKWVGESESATSRTLDIIERMAPTILLIDEIEKALAGSSSSGSASDGGTMRRMLATILTWLQDKTSEVYVIGTANDISSLPPELSRAGRFDAIFFLDFPNEKQRRKIWKIYRNKHHISESDPLPDDTGWTGTEIEQCCRMSQMLGKPLADAAEYIVPVYKASSTQLETLRQYANGRFLDANVRGLYHAGKADRVPNLEGNVYKSPTRRLHKESNN
jgi:ATP-dependent 26S proteasome regulatory subunit